MKKKTPVQYGNCCSHIFIAAEQNKVVESGTLKVHQLLQNNYVCFIYSMQSLRSTQSLWLVIDLQILR